MGKSSRLYQKDFKTLHENPSYWVTITQKNGLLKMRNSQLSCRHGEKGNFKVNLEEMMLKVVEVRFDPVIDFERVFGISAVSWGVQQTKLQTRIQPGWRHLNSDID